MPVASYQIGESFPVQFAWKLPNGDFLRAVFRADVIGVAPASDKYIVRLSRLIAGRQETAKGRRRPIGEHTREYWELVGRIVGRKLAIAFEADDGRALQLRLATLTGEHNFFRRFEEAEAALRAQEASRKDSSP